MGKFKNLAEMKMGQSGRIVEIKGGVGLNRHLESLGVRVGKKITKVSAQLWRGPQVIKIGTIQIALGFGVSKKIIVEVDK